MSTPSAVYRGILRYQQERQYETSEFSYFHANWVDNTQGRNLEQSITVAWRNWLGILMRKQAILELA